MVGQQLGPYRIVAPLGAGGMGEVYRARDSKLGRDVAIKILPSHFTADPERRARFAREARLLATLNHPNIGAIYGLEEVDGDTALVLELVEGPTLADRLERGPLKVSDALAIARQIAEALDAAHEKGIVHRDLKPANIILEGAGGLTSGDVRVKVLDFSLAKLVHADPEADATAVTLQSTEGGRILGTPAYMSPEQARGLPIDKRTDIWGFGCVLFEMLTGQRAFAGETLSDVLVRIIEHEPDWQTLPVRTPAAIRRLLRRCLEKDPKRRLDSAAVARIEIDEAAREPTAVVEAAGTRRGSLWRPIAWAATGAGVAVLVTMMPAGRARPTERPGPLVATSFVDAVGLNVMQSGVHFAVAPGGRTVVFAGEYGGRRILYRRDLDRVDPEPIVGTEGGSDVFFSHDGRWLAFEKDSELWTTSLDGGTPQRLLPNQPLRGGTWGEGDRIVVGRVGSGLWMASITIGGAPRQLTTPRQGERHELPQMLPGGRAVLFTVFPVDKPPHAAVHLVDTGETRSLFEGTGARFVGSGYIVFGRQERLWAVGFDPDSLQTLGAARAVRDDVLWSAAGYPQFAVDAGLLLYVRAGHASSNLGNRVLTWVDRRGRKSAVPLKANSLLAQVPRLSPTADRLLVQIPPSMDLWIYHFGRGTSTKLTSDRIIASSAAAWTPDGSRVIFATWFDGEVGLGLVHADGSSPVEELIKGVGMRSFERTQPVMLPDGSGVIMTGLAPGGVVEDLLFVPLTGDRRLEPVLQAPGVERNPAIAPSGRFLAYNSDESGTSQVYVRPFPNAGSRKWQISTDGGTGPGWTRGGSEIVYQDSQGSMVAVAVLKDRDGEFDYSKPEPLFKVGPGGTRGLDRGWDVTADGERFLFILSDSVTEGTERAVELILIQNWTEELKRLAPRQPR